MLHSRYSVQYILFTQMVLAMANKYDIKVIASFLACNVE